MHKKMGRPQKSSPEEKLAIVNQFYISRTGETASAIGAHGIYSKLAEFAKSLGYQLEAYDFSRDEAVREHISRLSTPPETPTGISAIPTFIPLDIPALINKGQKQIEKALQDRENYLLSLYMRAAQIIEDEVLLSKRVQYLQTELKASLEKQKLLEENNTHLAKDLREAHKRISYLKRVIRKDIEPENAQKFLSEITSRETIIDITQRSVMTNIESLTREDSRLRQEAENEIDSYDLNTLSKLLQ